MVLGIIVLGIRYFSYVMIVIP